MEKVRIALLGFGNVGRAFTRYVGNDPRIEIRAVADSSGGVVCHSATTIQAPLDQKASGQKIASFSSSDAIYDPHNFIESLKPLQISCVIESLPTNIHNGQPALNLLMQTLRQGIHVVTVDKGPLVHGFESLQQAAQSGGSRFAFTGTTGVAIPEQVKGQKVLEISGVLNGTTNSILTAMQELGLSFNEALEQAQGDGIAEPDPSLDTQGWDTACKILILAKALMGADATLTDVSRAGIGEDTEELIDVARRKNQFVRLIGRAHSQQNRLSVSVAPEIVAKGSLFYSISGTAKAAIFRTTAGEIISHARSGRDAISQIILEDLQKIMIF